MEWSNSSQIRRFKTLNMPIIPKLIYRFNIIPIKIPGYIFINQQTHSKIHTARQIKQSQHFEKRTKLEVSKLPDFQTYYKTTVRCGRADRHKNKWNTINSTIRCTHISINISWRGKSNSMEKGKPF